ncbi:MAG: adenylate/guanylate cyclase domain-containing protein, partial [Alphaproteobacteria bacterium]
VLGSPVNLAARLQSAAEADVILIDENTQNLVAGHVGTEKIDQIAPKGFVRPIQVYQVSDFLSEEHRSRRRQLSRVGEHVEVNVIDSSNIRAAIAELRGIQEDFEKQFDGS